MINRTIDMRVEAATNAAEIRQLKTEERKVLRYARHVKHRQHNSTNTAVSLAYSTHRNIYHERMECRREARLHHLARMLLKGKDYKKVEALTYEQVDAEALADRIWMWEPSISQELVTEWLGQEAA